MARMYPSSVGSDAPDSERKVFQALEAGLPDSFVVIHSRRVVLPRQGSRAPQEGEVDFVVLDPERGILGLEVKGGQIGRDEQGWYSISSGGRRYALKSDPGLQARRSIGTLVDSLHERPAFQRMPRIFWTWGVVFPDVTARGDLDHSLPRSVILDSMDLLEPLKALRRVQDSNGKGASKLDGVLQRLLLKEIAPSFDLVPTLANRFLQEAPALVRLTEEQMQVLDTLENCPRVCVEGPAGTGKTLVALEKARRLAADEARTLYVCFNQPLADHIARDVDAFRVSTFHKLCSDMVRAAGLAWRPPAAGPELSQYFAEEAPDLLEQALDRLPDERFDAVIVDEGQDFRELWWPVLEKLLRDPKKSVLYVFQDPLQNLYGGSLAGDLKLVPAALKYNCRNTSRIARFASNFVGSQPVLRPGTPEGIEVATHEVTAARDQPSAVGKVLHDLVRNQGVQERSIVVLSTQSAEASPVGKAGKLGNFKLVPLDTRPGSGEIRFGSLHRFKGLDEEVVVLCDVSPGMESAKATELYVGTSRARLALVIVRTKT